MKLKESINMGFGSLMGGLGFLKTNQNYETRARREVGGDTEGTFKDVFPFFTS